MVSSLVSLQNIIFCIFLAVVALVELSVTDWGVFNSLPVA